MSLDTLHPSLPTWLASLEARLQSLFVGEYALLHEAAVGVVGTRGKRLRPAVLLLSASCFGALPPRAVDYAACVELIHTASLVHDDVVDEAHSRRGVPAAHVRWGNKFSVLLGDYLLARVFELASEEAVPAILRILAATATDMGRAVTRELTALDLSATEETYWTIVHGKTATLFQAAAGIGAVVGGATPDQQAALARMGRALGLAFQVADDLLDLQGGEDASGKPHALDWQQRRATLPLIYALRRGSPATVATLRALWGQDTLAAEDLNTLQRLVHEAGGFDYGWRKVKEYQDEACASLQAVPEGDGRAALLRMCRDQFPLPVLPVAV